MNTLTLAAAVVKVVYCRDCEYFDTNGYVKNAGMCNYHESVMRGNDYCSYGERKSDE